MATKQQMSQRMMKSTEDGRPYAQEFQDLFAALVTTLNLKPHRVRLQKRIHTFVTKDAVEKLSALKLTSTNRRPDPRDPHRVYTTTTTTTFAMNRECARSHCQKFLEARYLESLEGKTDFRHDGDVWQLTPKGVSVLKAFALRLGINDAQVWDLCQSPKGNMHLVMLERESADDSLVHDRATVDLIFRRFAGSDGPNIQSGSHSDTDSLYEYSSGLSGVKMTRGKKTVAGNALYSSTFNGKAAVEWLMDCCTTVTQNEAQEIAQWFLTQGLIQSLTSERRDIQRFMPIKSALYAVTAEGRRVAGWGRSKESGDAPVYKFGLSSNSARLLRIIGHPALRSLFREYLRETHCEENLVFYMEVEQLMEAWTAEKKLSGPPRPSVVRELITVAYGLYNAFLAPSSACEVNIDHLLRNNIATRMSDIVHKDDEKVADFFNDIEVLFRAAQSSVFKLISSDSVPKFTRDEKYGPQLREKNLARALGMELAPEEPGRSGSTSSDSDRRSGSFSSAESGSKSLPTVSTSAVAVST